jgi:hypothetical protein
MHDQRFPGNRNSVDNLAAIFGDSTKNVGIANGGGRHDVVESRLNLADRADPSVKATQPANGVEGCREQDDRRDNLGRCWAGS